MNIGILTSSRADFGIYRPLLHKLKEDPSFKVSIIVFGTHLSQQHGLTRNEIEQEGFEIAYQIPTLVEGDSPETIASTMALTAMKFTDLWKEQQHKVDLVCCLGDRYEMFAAVQAAIPFGIPFAHIHGGETTLGAIDNTFRHCLSIMSQYHFVSHPDYADRVQALTGSSQNIFTVGALSLDNMDKMPLLSVEEFRQKYGVDLSRPTLLVTFHPETVGPESNEQNVRELTAALAAEREYQVLITGTNADTRSGVIRSMLQAFVASNPDRAYWVEHLGSRGYFSAMKNCTLMLGNTSSGIIEAASLGARVVNLGKRQTGRLTGDNVMTVPIEERSIRSAITEMAQKSIQQVENIYWQGGAADKIIKVLKDVSNG